MSDDVTARLTEVFRGSTRSPEHLAFLAAPVVRDLMASAVDADHDQTWEDGYAVGYEDGSEDTWRSIHDDQDDHDAEDVAHQ